MAERHIDGRLSMKCQRDWPGALVVREVDDDGRSTYWLERPGQQRVGIGEHLPELHRSLEALRRAEEAALEALRRAEDCSDLAG